MNSSTTLYQPEAEITQMIQKAAGNPEMSEKLWATCYEELRRLARKVMLENQNSLSPTGLVHEVFFRLNNNTEQIRDRGHFFALACRAMRQVKIQHYRAKQALKRQNEPDMDAWVEGKSIDALALEEALCALEIQHPRLARVVETRFFAGFGREEAASLLGISPATLDRDWLRAKTYLLVLLQNNTAD